MKEYKSNNVYKDAFGRVHRKMLDDKAKECFEAYQCIKQKENELMLKEREIKKLKKQLSKLTERSEKDDKDK